MRISIIDIVVAGLVLWLSAQAWGDTTSEWDDPTTGELSYVGTGQKVGIGTDTPGAELDVRGGQAGAWNESITTRSSAWPYGRASMGNYSGEGMIRVYDSSSTINAQIPGSTGIGYTYFNAGNVGIGTTTPSVSLHNNGDFITKGPWIDVRAYGATGDGVTDDRAAIQSAIDAASTNKRAIFLPAGTYKITSALTFSTGAHAGLMMFGVGNQSRISHTGTDSAIEIGDGVTSLQGIHFEKFAITGTSSGSAGIRIKYFHRSTFRDLSIEGYTSTTAGIDGEGGAGIKLENVIIDAFERCHLNGNYNGLWARGAVGVINGVEIVNCRMENNTNAGVELRYGNQVSVTGCVIKSSNYGIWVNGAGRAWNFSNNYFELTTISAIQIDNSLNVGAVIEGNYFAGGSAQEIYIKGGRGWTICGNAFQTASVNSLIRIKGGSGGPAIYGVIDGNGVDSNINPSYTFFSNDDTTITQVVIQDPKTGIYGMRDSSVSGTGIRLGVDGNGVKIGESGDIATIKKHFTATATWDPPSLSNGSSAQILLTVNGAVAGDTACASHTQTGTAKINISAYVTAANQVAVVIHNISGGSLNILSGTVRADVWQY